MDLDANWTVDVDELHRAASDVGLLARLLDVGDHLASWATRGDETAGAIAADALDQARGLLEEFAADRVAGLLRVVERLAKSLPPPLE